MQLPLTKSLTALSLFGRRAAYFVLRRQITRLGEYCADQQSGRNSGKSGTFLAPNPTEAEIHGVSEVDLSLGLSAVDEQYRDKFLVSLDALGEDAVRLTLAGNDWHVEREPTKRRLAEHWLKSKDDERTAAAEARRDAREEETLSIAREANRIAERALSKATMANIWAAIAALIATIAIYAAIFIDKP